MAKPLICSPELFYQDLSDKTYIVTGGNSGIGRITVEQLAKQNAHVVLACRRVGEGEKCKAEINQENPGRKIDVAELDLGSLSSVRAFAGWFSSSHKQLHGLVNNAGVMNTPFGRTKDGFETQFGTNHLGHFLLTELLLPILKSSAPARIVNLSSCYHDKAQGREGRIDFSDLNYDNRKYDGWEAYAQSKLANLLHARHLAKLHADNSILSVSVHPGWVRTNLIRHSAPTWVQDFVLLPFFRLGGMIEPWEGAQTTLHALLSPDITKHNGAFFSQTGIYREKKAQKGGWPLHSPNPNAHDDATAERLYTVSRTMVGL
ncbi:MAG: SDR family oxidoreductase [Silvanigrellaceae bacterium]